MGNPTFAFNSVRLEIPDLEMCFFSFASNPALLGLKVKKQQKDGRLRKRREGRRRSLRLTPPP